ncbi:DnaJ domain-containing protein, partial [Pavlovales sp. CCMP2436]
HYERISLPTSCSIAEVEKQYKRLSIQCHPDKSDNPRATDAFKSLNDARGVLSDVEKRTRYD